MIQHRALHRVPRFWRRTWLLVSLSAVLALATTSVAASSGVGGQPDWRRFGGPNGDFTTDVELPAAWPEQGPRVLWSRSLGEGYSSIAVADGVLYTQYLDGDQDVTVALSADDGDTLWSYRNPNTPRSANLVEFGRGPNATPLITADVVITLGYTGWLNCLDRRTGELRWSHELVRDFDADVLPWGYSASPIEHDGKIIVLVGGERQGAVAFDPKNGLVIWRSPPSSVSYATPIIIDSGGREQLLYFAADALVALDPGTGRRLWSYPVINGYQNHASLPLPTSDNRLMVVTQQEGAGRLLKLPAAANGEVEELWYSPRIRVHHWNAVIDGDTAFAAVGDGIQVLAGVDVATGEVLWRERGYGVCNLVRGANGYLILDGGGDLLLADLDRKGMRVRSRFKLFDGISWTTPSLVGNRLYARDKKQILALELGP